MLPLGPTNDVADEAHALKEGSMVDDSLAQGDGVTLNFYHECEATLSLSLIHI